MIPFLLTQLALRLRWHQRVLPFVSWGMLLAMGGLWPLIAGLSWYGWDKHPNAVFALTHLNLPQLTVLAATVTLSFLLNSSQAWWRRWWRQVVTWLPLAIFAIFLMVSWWPLNYFKEVVKEDHLVEWLQFWVLFLGAGLQLGSVRRHWQAKNYLRFAVAAVTLLGFTLVAGDEISWGQRLLGLQVEESIQEINRQGEITFHNLYAVEWLMIYAYTTLSAVGTVTGLAVRSVARLRQQPLLAPAALLVGYFAFPLLFFVQQLRIQWGIWHSWSEIAELSLYLGLVLWVILFEHWQALTAWSQTKKSAQR